MLVAHRSAPSRSTSPPRHLADERARRRSRRAARSASTLAAARRATSRSPTGATRSCRCRAAALLINDAWNANPVSMRAALEHLRRASPAAAARSPCSGTWPSSAPYADGGPPRGRRARSSELGDRRASSRSAPQARAYGGRRVASGRRRRLALLDDAAPARRLRPRQGRARDRPRARRRGPDDGAPPRWSDVLIAGIVALVISIVAGPRFIDFLRRREYGQQIREEGPRPRRQAGHADDGRPADHVLGGRPVPDAQPTTRRRR